MDVLPSASSSLMFKPRIAFATKFCHYVCFYVFEGQPEQDNFSIYDNVVAGILPYYAIKYKIDYKKVDFKKYSQYIGLVDEIIRRSGSNISRNGFDHLLWYYYKGRPELVKRALSKLPKQ